MSCNKKQCKCYAHSKPECKKPECVSLGSSCEVVKCDCEYKQCWSVQVKDKCSCPAECCVVLCTYPVVSYTGTCQEGEREITGKILHTMPNEFKEMFGDSALVEWTSYGDCGPDVPLLVAEAGSDVAFGYKCGTGLTNPVLLSDCTIKVSNGSGKFAIKYLADFAGWVGMIITAKCKGCDGVSTSRFFTLDGLPHTKHNRDFLCCKDSPYGTELDLPIVVS